MPKKARSRPAKARKAARGAVKRVDVKLPNKLYVQMEALVKEGYYFSMSDFGRTAIREKLQALGAGKKR